LEDGHRNNDNEDENAQMIGQLFLSHDDNDEINENHDTCKYHDIGCVLSKYGIQVDIGHMFLVVLAFQQVQNAISKELPMDNKEYAIEQEQHI
jgi:hypothetical protein